MKRDHVRAALSSPSVFLDPRAAMDGWHGDPDRWLSREQQHVKNVAQAVKDARSAMAPCDFRVRSQDSTRPWVESDSFMMSFVTDRRPLDSHRESESPPPPPKIGADAYMLNHVRSTRQPSTASPPTASVPHIRADSFMLNHARSTPQPSARQPQAAPPKLGSDTFMLNHARSTRPPTVSTLPTSLHFSHLGADAYLESHRARVRVTSSSAAQTSHRGITSHRGVKPATPRGQVGDTYLMAHLRKAASSFGRGAFVIRSREVRV